MTPVLYIANKNYSSWSLRPWLALKWGSVAFDEHMIVLGGEGYGTARMPEVLAVSPSGRVPVLHLDGETRIWDSLAICEWAAEQNPSLWPHDSLARAVARSVASEMHSGFTAVRRDLSMNIRRRTAPRDWPQDTLLDIERIQTLLTQVRDRYGKQGPFLFGERSIADAMMAPVCTRLRTYGVAINDTVQAYSDTIFADAAFRSWEDAAKTETWTIQQTDVL